MRAIIEGFPFGWQIDIVNGLEIEPLYWLANDIGQSNNLPKECIFHSAESLISWDVPEEIYLKLNINSNIEYIPDSTLLSDAGQIDKITRIIRIRKDLYGKNFVSNEGKLRRAVYRQIAFWMAVIKKIKAEIVLFESVPHLVHHYTLYYVAKKLGIRTVIFNRVGEPLRFFMTEEIDNLAPEMVVNEAANADIVSPIRSKPKYAISGPSGSQTRDNPVNLRKTLANTHKIFTLGTYYYAQRVFKDKAYRITYEYLYNKYALKELPSNKFIYFPLHESPEDTTYPMGENFEDQVYALQYLSELLPDDVLIVVKEHPNQRFWRGRYLSFYADLVAIENVVLIGQNIDSFDIIDKCALIATITGQTGWEALTNNKRAIYFGQAWYKGAPGTIYIDDFKNMTIHKRKEFIGDIAEIDLQSWYQEFHTRTFPGYVNHICSGERDLDTEATSFFINSYLQKIT